MADEESGKSISEKRWKYLACALGAGCVVLTIVLVSVLASRPSQQRSETEPSPTPANILPCPPKKGGLLTTGEPEQPSPFHDLTIAEYERLYEFLAKQKELNLVHGDAARVNTSYIFTVDLLLPPKQQVLSFLDNEGTQPAREARVMIFRGDKPMPVVEEYRVGPLQRPTHATLIVNPQRTNPAPFTVRPFGDVESSTMETILLFHVDEVVGDILMESYGGRYGDCGDTCLSWTVAPLGTAFLRDVHIRKLWIVALYPTEFEILYPLDFSCIIDMTTTDPNDWTVGTVWYAGTFFDTLEDLKNRYHSDPTLPRTRVTKSPASRSLKSTLTLRGDPVPTPPQRPPVQVEPDGKRYSIQHRHVSYMHWDFDIRLSALTGPQVYDVRYHGDRIAYELGLSEIAVFYSGHGPMQQLTNFVDSGELLGINSRSLVPGADCPEGATFLDVPMLSEGLAEATNHARAMCVFEVNTGDPLKRHLAYLPWEGSFYGGMANSVLTVRAILTMYNYDYVIDFIFYQTGAIETRAMSTGYIMASFYRPEEAPYGFRLDENIMGNLHHHMFHFKADLDIGGTSNRYETLDLSEEEVELTYLNSTTKYSQLRFYRNLRQTENDAVYKFNFNTPKYHIVHNEQNKTEFGVPRAYRVHMEGMSKQLLPPGVNNEVTIPWARQQLAVTVQKDDELVSSSPYAMFDSQQPVTDFSNFISNESIVDKDLVFWITMGTHHLPHTEDLPVTSTVGCHLSFFLLPYNYFPECPSVSSRDAIRLEYVTARSGADSKIRVQRNGNAGNTQCGEPTLEKLVKERPDDFLYENTDE